MSENKKPFIPGGPGNDGYPVMSEDAANRWDRQIREGYIFELQVMVKETVVSVLHVRANTFEEAKNKAALALHVEIAERLVPTILID